MKPIKAAVTGATGFIGSRLCRALIDQGCKVTVIGRTGSTEELIETLTPAKPQIVFHLASLFLSDHLPRDIERLVASNLLFGSQLLEAMAEVGIKRIVNAGSYWQHPAPRNLYAATKTAFESILGYYVAAQGFRVTTLTLPDTYGPGDTRRKLINVMREYAQSGARLAMLPPNHLIDLVHVDDVCRALIAAADLYSGRWSVSAGKIRLEAVVKEFQKASGKTLNIGWGERKYRPREASEPWIGEILPGWAPQISLREGMNGLFR